MIANDSIGFSILGNYLACHFKVKKHLSIMDLYDIFKVLSMLRICSWQEFKIFAKPKVFMTDEYLSLCYSKKGLEMKLLNRNIIENKVIATRKENKDPESPVWIEVISILFKEEPKDLESRIKGALKKLNDDYEFIPNLWSFEFEQSDGSYVTDKTIINPETFHLNVRHNIDLEELLHDYLTNHPAQFYKLFNESVKWQMETACELVSDDNEEEEYIEESSD